MKNQNKSSPASNRILVGKYLDREGVSTILLDTVEDQELISWFSTRPEWTLEALTDSVTLCHRSQKGVMPREDI